MDKRTNFAGKMQVFLPTPPSGGLFAFSGDGLVPSKPLCLSDAYEERFMKRLKISEGQPSPSSLGSIYGSVALTIRYSVNGA